MKRVGVEDWQRWRSEGYSRLPVIRQHQEAALPPTWESVADGVASVWLESAQAGRYSYVCGATDRVITGHLDHATLWSGDCSCRTGVLYGSPLAILSELLRRQRAPKESGWPAMTGGLIGVLGFDVVRTWERLPTAAKRDLAIPLYAMIEPRELYIYDHQERVLWIAVWCDAPPDSKLDDAFQSGNGAADRAWLRWQEACRVIGTVPLPNSDDVPADDVPAPSFDGAKFHRAVTRIQEYIAAGDTYQVNVSLRTSRRTRVSTCDNLRSAATNQSIALHGLLQGAGVCAGVWISRTAGAAGRWSGEFASDRWHPAPR